MKRIDNLYQQICSIENLQLADAIARKGKARQPGVIAHDKNRDANVLALHSMLVNMTYRTSPYTIFKVYEPKEREVYRLPYYPDRIVHHAIMNVLEPVFVATFTADSYSNIKRKGTHAMGRAIRKALKDVPGTQYCLKIDIKKFYPSVNHSILKQIIRRKIKDAKLLQLLDEIIDSAPGLPIGNYLSQYFANLYLTYFDHWLKEVMGVKDYSRYADDMVILASSKPYLHELLASIKLYLHDKLQLEVKHNYQIFPVAARGIDCIGEVNYHTHALMRKRIKVAFARKVAKSKKATTKYAKNKYAVSIASYIGWAKHTNSKHLLKKLLNEAV